MTFTAYHGTDQLDFTRFDVKCAATHNNVQFDSWAVVRFDRVSFAHVNGLMGLGSCDIGELIWLT